MAVRHCNISVVCLLGVLCATKKGTTHTVVGVYDNDDGSGTGGLMGCFLESLFNFCCEVTQKACIKVYILHSLLLCHSKGKLKNVIS